ncbi:MAG: histidine kinase N-terminal 7TM domain-containing protein [Halalkalicoccus sp.]
MPWQQTPYTLPLVLGAIGFAATAIYVLVRPGERARPPGTNLAAALLVASGFWLLTYALELSSASLEGAILWSQVQYFGATVVPVLCFVYVLRYTGVVTELSLRAWVALGAIPAVTVLLAVTNASHGLIWEEFTLVSGDGYTRVAKSHGPWFAVYIVYAYG